MTELPEDPEGLSVTEPLVPPVQLTAPMVPRAGLFRTSATPTCVSGTGPVLEMTKVYPTVFPLAVTVAVAGDLVTPIDAGELVNVHTTAAPELPDGWGNDVMVAKVPVPLVTDVEPLRHE